MKKREFPVDKTQELLHRALYMKDEEVNAIAEKLKNLKKEIISEKKTIYEVAQEIGETFSLEELVLDVTASILQEIKEDVRRKKCNCPQCQARRAAKKALKKTLKKEEKDDDDIDFNIINSNNN